MARLYPLSKRINFDIIKFILINYRVQNWRVFIGIALFPVLDILFANPHLLAMPSFYVSFVILLVAISFYLAFAFSVNNCYDISEDILEGDELKNPIASNLLPLRIAKLTSYGVAILGTFFVFITIGFNELFLLYLSLMIVAWAYSAPPIRLKSKPFFDFLSHSLFFGSLLYVFSYSYIYETSLLTAFLQPVSIIILIYSMSLELRNHYEDYEYDKASNNKTTVVFLGRENSFGLLIIILVILWAVMAYYVYIMVSMYLAVGYLLILILQLLNYRKWGFQRWMRLQDLSATLTMTLLTIL